MKRLVFMLLLLTVMFTITSAAQGIKADIVVGNVLVIENDTVAIFSKSDIKTVNKIFAEHNVQGLKIVELNRLVDSKSYVITALDSNNRTLTLVIENKNKVIKKLIAANTATVDQYKLLIKRYRKQRNIAYFGSGTLFVLILVLVI